MMDFKTLPEVLPIFPLPRALLLPRAELPLNIFEPRYIAMTDDVLKGERLIGMIQPRFCAEDANSDPNALYETGCAGRISSFAEAGENRYQITLTGLCRFKITKEISKAPGGYRRVVPDWSYFTGDLAEENVEIDRARMLPYLRSYLEKNKMSCDKWSEIMTVPAEKLVSCLSMICPFNASEKQALLESPDLAMRAQRLCTLLEIHVRADQPERVMH